MTREEAIAFFKDMNECTYGNLEAVEMAIKALEQSSGDTISRQDAIKAIDEKAKRIKNEDTLNGLAGAVAILFDLPSVNPQPKTDAWSIKDVADTFKKHGLIVEQEPCDDAISREELLKAIDTWDKFGCDADTKLVPYQDHYIPYIHYDDVVKCIKGMPTVAISSAEPKTGHWIYDYTSADGHKTYHCSECGCYLQPKHSEPLNSFKWCSSCGVKMVEPQEISEHNLKMWKDIYEEEKRRERSDKE